MVAPYFPSPGNKSDINEPGHYIGYFALICQSGVPYNYTPPTDWELIGKCSYAGVGLYGYCPNCIVSKLELKYVGPDIGLEPEPLIDKSTPALVVLIILIAAYFFLNNKW